MAWSAYAKRHSRSRRDPRARARLPAPALPLKRRKRVNVRAITALVLLFPLLLMLRRLPATVRPLPPPRPTGPTAANLGPVTTAHVHRAPVSADSPRREAAFLLNATLQAAVSLDNSAFQPRLGVAPRATAYTALASRLTDERVVPSVTPVLHAVLVCHFANPCCYATLPRALAALARQSLPPDSLRIVHSCTTQAEHARMLTAARRVVGMNEKSDSYARSLMTVSDEPCARGAESQRQFDLCVLRYLAHAARRVVAPFTVVVSDRDVLEPTALEKSWMYLTLRNNVTAVRSLSYDAASLQRAAENADPLQVKRELPSWNHSLSEHLSPLPLVYKGAAFESGAEEGASAALEKEPSAYWSPLIRVLSRGRIIREALYTYIKPSFVDGDINENSVPLSLRNAGLRLLDLPAHLLSDIAFYKWSARQEEDEIYANDLSALDERIDLSPMTQRVIEAPPNGHRLFIVMPWLQMGGSEKAMLDLAERVSSMKWALTFVLTMPDWHEDGLGELGPQHQWIDKALALTSDVFDVVVLSVNEKSSRAFRHLLQSRKPDYILMSNTRWAYAHSPLIKALLPQSTVADYNHMIHPSWNGGGLPRYGANYSAFFDVHFTASMDVASPMEKWIDSKIMERQPHKVKPCHIGTDPKLFYHGEDKMQARIRMRRELDIAESVTVVLFAGRFVNDKGIDVLIEVVEKVAADAELADELFFLFVGDGEQRHSLESAQRKVNKDGQRYMLVRRATRGLVELRDYYAMSDVLMLPSINEGIALVVYEGMAAGLVVMTTDVGGQKEVVTPETGVLIRNSRVVQEMTSNVLTELKKVLEDPVKYSRMRVAGRKLVESQYTTQRFCDCVIKGLVETKASSKPLAASSTEVSAPAIARLERDLVKDVQMERFDGLWKRGAAIRHVDKAITIGIKAYVCDGQTVDQVHSLIRSIRVNYPKVRVLLGNDGPTRLRDEEFVRNDPYTEEFAMPAGTGISTGRNALVNATTTKFYVSLDDDHMLDDTTDLGALVKTLETDQYDIAGMRIRNLPGIDELERTGISIPRYVSVVQSLRNRTLTLCLWNENEGPSVFGMQHAVPVDVLHNAFVARTDVLRRRPWRDILQVNEHMTFFLDAKKAGVRVGYLPSQFVHHRAREYSKCYYTTRFREDKFRELLDYEDRFYYDIQCGDDFPRRVRNHILRNEFDYSH